MYDARRTREISMYDARCIREIKYSIIMAKATFNKKKALFSRKLDSSELDQKYLQRF